MQVVLPDDDAGDTMRDHSGRGPKQTHTVSSDSLLGQILAPHDRGFFSVFNADLSSGFLCLQESNTFLSAPMSRPSSDFSVQDTHTSSHDVSCDVSRIVVLFWTSYVLKCDMSLAVKRCANVTHSLML